MNKLFVVANFDYSKRNDGLGLYLLILPQNHTILWGHYCSNSDFALSDLRYNNSRKQILDDLFGKDCWELVLYKDKWESWEIFWKWADNISKNNVLVDLSKIDILKKKYKEQGGNY